MMLKYFSNCISLFYPPYCNGCGNVLVAEEKYLCFSCLKSLPRTDFHTCKDNPLEMVFAGRVPICRATAFCFFRKGNMVQHLIHQLKYNGNQEIGVYLGRQFGLELIQLGVFQSVDIIVPIPLHFKKLKRRGYNQSEKIGKGMIEVMPKPLDSSSLIRVTDTSTQTKKERFQRWENVLDIFQLTRTDLLAGKHILLIDDVITTGATTESAAQLLLTLPAVKVSIACIGYAGS
ncbi:MAG: ComF family protein [Bacteroidales bacterium]|jgi:ComF family protein|nr:ComF family protein [Bacteroidales bacterium]